MADVDVRFRRGTKSEIDNIQKEDGQVLWTTDQGENNHIYTDVKSGNTIERIEIGGKTNVDNQLSGTSTNPVQNKVVTEYVYGIESGLDDTDSFIVSNDEEGWGTTNKRTDYVFYNRYKNDLDEDNYVFVKYLLRLPAYFSTSDTIKNITINVPNFVRFKGIPLGFCNVHTSDPSKITGSITNITNNGGSTSESVGTCSFTLYVSKQTGNQWTGTIDIEISGLGHLL